MEVALLTLGDPARMTGGYLFHRRMADRAAAHGARLGFVSIPDLPLAWSIGTGVRWLRDPVLRSADVVVLDSLAAAAAAPWLDRVRTPIVGMLHQPPGGYGAPFPARAVRAAFDRWAYRRAALLMVASDWLAAELTSNGRPGRLRVVVPGKDPVAREAVAGDAEALEEQRLRARGGRRIALLCVGSWLPTKGIAELLDAVARLPGPFATLHLAGDTRPGTRYGRRLRRRLGRSDLRGRVVVHGVVAPAAVAGLYRSVDAFVLPSFAETYGTVWGEAMAAGLPVIGWRAGNLPFLADDGREGLLVSPGDVEGLGAAIAHLALDGAARARMGAAAAARAASRPTWDETADRFFGLLADVVAAHDGRGSPAPPAHSARSTDAHASGDSKTVTRSAAMPGSARSPSRTRPQM